MVWNLKLFLAISRTSHSIVDLATPVLAVLIWLGRFPPVSTVIIGFVTAFAGYTAVYALNDLVDAKVDAERDKGSGPADPKEYLDTVYVRHPVARGLLSFKLGLLWAGGWALLALIGAYLLNPVCAVIFLCSILLETIYCLMAKVSHLRVIISGFVKTSGAIAAVFAVDPSPQAFMLFLLFLWLFFWEVGGQNVPADWFDMEEDRHLNFRTIPARFGPDVSAKIVLSSIIITLVMNVLLLVLMPHRFSFFVIAGSLLAGSYLLLLPGFNLYRMKAPSLVSKLFNRASFYPLALLLVMLFDMVYLKAGGR
jgi:4-hydroxybenzoate polyprenyltransferase